MNEKDIRIYKIIGRIHSCITSSKDFDEAVTACLKTVLQYSMADYAAVWRADDSEVPVLRPVYWICPVDLSSGMHRSGESLVGRVYKNQASEAVSGEAAAADTALAADFAGMEIGSIACVPLGSGNTCYGCVQFIRTPGKGAFTPDEVDTCELLTYMAQTELEEVRPESHKSQKDILLSARNIHKYYQSGETRNHVLKGVNLDVYKGEFVCLLGESGCGKSTMLNIIGGLLDLDEGTLTFDGKDISKFNEKELTEYRRDNIGFIFQAYNLMPNLNAKQNVDLIAELVKEPADSEELLKLVGLSEQKDHYPSQLSGGQQQRIAIARAMVKKPPLILADEPTAALDYATSIEVLSVMENVVKDGTTLMVVTHNEEIAKMADRVVRFRNGQTYEIRINAHPLHAADLVW